MALGDSAENDTGTSSLKLPVPFGCLPISLLYSVSSFLFQVLLPFAVLSLTACFAR